MPMKAKVTGLLASVAGSVFLLALLEIIILVLDDIRAGALGGVAETGWSFLVATFLYVPVTVVSLIAFLLLSRSFVNASQKSRRPLLIASVVLALIFGCGFVVYDKVANAPENEADRQTALAMSQTERSISKLYYAKKGVLPAASEVDGPADTTYKIINENTYEFCGSFVDDNLKNMDAKYSETANGKIAKKVLDGDTLKSYEAMGVFSLHGAGQQCYRIELTRPLTQ